MKQHLISFNNTHDLQWMLSFLSGDWFMNFFLRVLMCLDAKHLSWKQHFTSSMYAEGRWPFHPRLTLAFSCVLAALHACVSLLLSLQPHYPAFIELSVSIKLAHFVSEGQFEAAQQLNWKCSLDQRSNLSLLTSIGFPLLAAEPSFLIILHVVETGTWRSLGIRM